MSVRNVILPKLGLTMDEGQIVAWHKREGDRIAEGEAIFEVETDKVTMEVEATTSGYLRKILVGDGQTVPVATVVGLVSDTADEPVGETTTGTATPEAAAAVVTSSPAPSGPTSRSESDRVAASPAARKRAQELGVDLASVTGSGPGGRIQIEDVERAAQR